MNKETGKGRGDGQRGNKTRPLVYGFDTWQQEDLTRQKMSTNKQASQVESRQWSDIGESMVNDSWLVSREVD